MTVNDTEIWAIAQDTADPLIAFRERFHIPREKDQEQIYFCGNSLGLQPRGARQLVEEELADWASYAVEAHFKGRRPWFSYHERLREPLAHVVGAEPIEVVAMNSLTANLHLMMASFYCPTAERPAILMEKNAFPSDYHAIQSQIAFHGFDPATDLIEIEGDEPGGTISDAAIARAIETHGRRCALVLLSGVQYLTGQAFDLKAITRLGHAQGCIVGFDLAHAVGNLPLQLHDAGCDFAVWCSYKYLNAGPGAVAGCFVHSRHKNTDRPRLAGWWGHRADTRFLMKPEFIPASGADGWQLSNPPIFSLAPLIASLEIFNDAGMDTLRMKSIALTGYLDALIEKHLGDVLERLTPADPERRGCQLSLRVRGGREQGKSLFDHLTADGIVGDWREPDVMRFSPTPLYNRHMDVLRLVNSIRRWHDGSA